MVSNKLFKIFAKSQIAATIGSAMDFLTFWLLMHVGGIYYVIARAIGAAVGAVVNYLMNRHWTWQTTNSSMGPEAVRYLIISAGSLLLNTFGTWFLTEYTEMRPLFSALVVSLVVAWGYNFVMHKIFVFKT